MPPAIMSGSDLAELLGSTNNHQDDDHVHPPVREAAVMELQRRYELLIESHELEPGMLVDYKDGFDQRHKCVQHYPMIFLRWLDASDPVDMLMIKDCLEKTYKTTVDCMILELAGEGAVTVPVPMDSNFLQPAPESR